jgi:hypothetical protein
MRKLFHPDTSRQERLPRIKALISRYSNFSSSLGSKGDELYLYGEEVRSLLLKLDAASMLLRSFNPKLVRNFNNSPTWDIPLNLTNADAAQSNLDILQARTAHLERLEPKFEAIFDLEKEVHSTLAELKSARELAEINKLDNPLESPLMIRINGPLITSLASGLMAWVITFDPLTTLVIIAVGASFGALTSEFIVSRWKKANEAVRKVLSKDHDRITSRFLEIEDSYPPAFLNMAKEALEFCRQGVDNLISTLLPKVSETQRKVAELSL